jgi:hypothetical protein
MVVNCDREDFLGMFLSDYMLIEKRLNNAWSLQIENRLLPIALFLLGWFFSKFTINNSFANANAGVTDVHASWPGNHFFYLALRFPAK